MNLALPLLAGGALMLLTSGAKAKTTGTSTPSPSGGGGGTATGVAQFQARIADALSRSDYAELTRIAEDMRKAGLTAEAASLMVSATSLHQMGALGARSPGQPSGTVPPTAAIPSPPITIPAVIPSGVALPPVFVPPIVAPSSAPLPAGVSITPEEVKRRATATAMATNLRNTSRYQENKTLVKSFQSQEGLKPDGLYGPKSALQLATYGIVPPRPRYWARKTVKVDKQTYTEKMVEYSIHDTARAADWLAASRVSSDPIG